MIKIKIWIFLFTYNVLRTYNFRKYRVQNIFNFNIRVASDHQSLSVQAAIS